jgi:hypothetical protein
MPLIGSGDGQGPHKINSVLTSVLWIDKVCSFSTNHLGLQSQLANPSSLMLTIPFLTTWELKTASELRFGEAPIPEYDEA